MMTRLSESSTRALQKGLWCSAGVRGARPSPDLPYARRTANRPLPTWGFASSAAGERLCAKSMMAARRPQGPQALGSNEVSRLWTCGRRAERGLFSCEVWTCRAPVSAVLDHRVENKHQLANAGGQRWSMRFAGRSQPQIEVAQRAAAQDRVVRRHVKRAAQIGTASKDVTLTAPFPTLAGEGRDADQRGDLARAERAQFRQARDYHCTG